MIGVPSGAKIGQTRSFRKGGENPELSPFCLDVWVGAVTGSV